MIHNLEGNTCDEATLALLKASSVKTKAFDLKDRHFVARLVKAHDADTITVTLVINPGDCHKISIRLIGFDSAEMNSKNLEEKAMAVKARKYFLRLISPEVFGEEADWAVEKDILKALEANVVLVHLKTQGYDKYGRCLGTVFRFAEDEVSLNQRMIESGMVDVYDGGHKSRSWDPTWDKAKDGDGVPKDDAPKEDAGDDEGEGSSSSSSPAPAKAAKSPKSPKPKK
eukprot:TRINITY_DN8157_c0_g2_i2.p1 TRINITY_DN8157_c0_g2~~TRINITY_DN8157_c0_g2_i2.p1  ORF type:complete len:227 (+),score=72.05 TRINITY_DN8157_c0_g2_i2:114-794(+)